MNKKSAHSSNPQSLSRRAVVKVLETGAATTALPSLALGQSRSAQSQAGQRQTVQPGFLTKKK